MVVEGKPLAVQNLVPFFKAHERLHEGKPADTVKEFGGVPLGETLFGRHQTGNAGHRITIAAGESKHMEQKNLVMHVTQFQIARIGRHVFPFLRICRHECVNGVIKHADLRINMARHVKHMRDVVREPGIAVGCGQRAPQVFASLQSVN